MELKDSLAIIISSITLVFVTVQFFIKRKDTQREFILNKRYEVYLTFLKQFSELDKEYTKFHDKTEELLNTNFKSDEDINLSEMQSYLRKYYKEILNFNFNVYEFNIIGSSELDKEIITLYNILGDRKRDIAKRIHNSKTVDECMSEFNKLEVAYSSPDSEFYENLSITYQSIKKLMKKDLGVKD